MSYIPVVCAAVFLLLLAGIVRILGLDTAARDRLRAAAERQSKAKTFKRRSRLRMWLDGIVRRCCELVLQSRMPIAVYAVMTALCAVGGFLAGRLIFVSLPISLAVGTFAMITPLLFFGYRRTKAQSAHLERLCSSMMILSHSYVTTEDFIVSVRDNLEILDYPKPFREFLTYVSLMDSNIKAGLRRMEQMVRNAYFSQWIDALELAQSDRDLKYVAVSVVDTMHDVLQVQAEADAALYAVWRDYIMTLILIFSVPLVFKFTLADAYLTLTTSAIGQGMFVLLLAAVIYSVLRALKINRPLMM